jgi:hypothetical protein
MRYCCQIASKAEQMDSNPTVVEMAPSKLSLFDPDYQKMVDEGLTDLTNVSEIYFDEHFAVVEALESQGFSKEQLRDYTPDIKSLSPLLAKEITDFTERFKNCTTAKKASLCGHAS